MRNKIWFAICLLYPIAVFGTASYVHAQGICVPVQEGSSVIVMSPTPMSAVVASMDVALVTATTVPGSYDPSWYDEWHPYVEPTLANVINLDTVDLDEEIDRVYYGIVGTRTPTP